MKKRTVLAQASLTGVALATLVAGSAFACHPQGSIIKKVQDMTTNSAIVDANTAASALAVNQGDILTYTITIANAETVEGNHSEADMTNTVMTDNLPAGVQLVSDPSQTLITENLGTIPAKGSVTKTYSVKVTAATDGAIITNKACYTSNSNIGKSYDQSGCDTAVVKVHVPSTPTPTPIQTPTPPTPPAKTLPSTGAGNVFLPAVIATVFGYAAFLFRSRRNLAVEHATTK